MVGGSVNNSLPAFISKKVNSSKFFKHLLKKVTADVLIDTLEDSEQLQKLSGNLDKLSVGDVYKSVLPNGIIYELRRLTKTKRPMKQASKEQTNGKISIQKPTNKRTTAQKAQISPADFESIASVVKKVHKEGNMANDAAVQVLDNNFYDEIEEDDDNKDGVKLIKEDGINTDVTDDDSEHKILKVGTDRKTIEEIGENDEQTQNKDVIRSDIVVAQDIKNHLAKIEATEDDAGDDGDGEDDYVSDQPIQRQNAEKLDTKSTAGDAPVAAKPSTRNLKFHDNNQMPTQNANINRNEHFSAQYVDAHTLIKHLMQNYFG